MIEARYHDEGTIYSSAGVFADEICPTRLSSTKMLERLRTREGCINRDIDSSLLSIWPFLNSNCHFGFVSLRGKCETLIQRPYSQLRGQVNAHIAPDVSLPLLANGPPASRALPIFSLSTHVEAIYAIHSALRAKPKTTNHCFTPHQGFNQIVERRPFQTA